MARRKGSRHSVKWKKRNTSLYTAWFQLSIQNVWLNNTGKYTKVGWRGCFSAVTMYCFDKSWCWKWTLIGSLPVHMAKTSFASSKRMRKLEQSGPAARSWASEAHVPRPTAWRTLSLRAEDAGPERATPQPRGTQGRRSGASRGGGASFGDGSGRGDGGRWDPGGPVAVLDSRPPGKAGAGGRGREGRSGGRGKEGRRETEGGAGERQGGGEGKGDDEGGRETGRRKTVRLWDLHVRLSPETCDFFTVNQN